MDVTSPKYRTKINRQPRRLESIVTHTRQTPAPQINRQQMRTLHPAFSAGLAAPQSTNRVTSNRHTRHSAPTLTRRLSLVTHHRRSNRHTSRLEIIKNPTKTHFSAVLIVTKARFLRRGRLPEISARGSRSTRPVISNRRWQILEFTVTTTKQTVGPRSNRHYFAVVKSQNSTLHRTKRSAPKTRPRVRTAITISPSAPTKNGRKPCLPSSRMLVRRPTPAKVSRKAQRERLARLVSWSLLKTWAVAMAEISRKPRTNFGNFCQRNWALL